MDPTIFDNNARKQIKKIDKGQKKVSIDSFQRYWWSKNPTIWLDERFSWPHSTKSGSLRSYLSFMIISMQKI